MTNSTSELVTIYDLHSHTTASDGSLSPSELVERAVAMGVNVLAVTDHDTTNAIPLAHEHIRNHHLPLKLIPGVEISTLWENMEIHIVGLNIDIQAIAITELLGKQAELRKARGIEIGRRLAKVGIPDAWAGASQLAGGGQVTRSHFARYLIKIGKEPTIAKVFKKYLAKGKIGYVPPQWCTIEQAIDAIHQSGGQAVIAHPGRYDLSAKWLKRLIVWFKQHGGDAMEVAQCRQAPNERKHLGQLSREYDLMASLGSDFHQPCSWIELGRKLWLPGDVIPIWRNWSL
ncbi:phosphatase [Photorhabdus temperata]|uniref:PHP domain-containing protein n=2 Tax=Photorhabdus khanii TaxID=1004150 RepID=A0A7C9KPS9_9GAMM|nr:PHP domain-containing protein [Photorhabdus khanii]ETS30646.1 putative metal-dependent phosphoesterase, PHP family [Photorhabdus khanii NC19]MQL47106.1 PHP domain-containing protein [Photorhabdus khanii]OHV54074.1 phosphatase [Photorhabdus temperata]